MATESMNLMEDVVRIDGEEYRVTTGHASGRAAPQRPPTAKNMTNRVAAEDLPDWEDGGA